jgi:hypothetical protein
LTESAEGRKRERERVREREKGMHTEGKSKGGLAILGKSQMSVFTYRFCCVPRL